MRFLVVGDFHGKFPKSISKIVRKQNIDAVISNGDYCPFYYRELWFKHSYRTKTELWEVIGKKKMRELLKKDLKSGEDTLRKLNNLKIPIFTVAGNLDYINYSDVSDKNYKPKWVWYDQDFFAKLIKKYSNILRFDYKQFNFGGFCFIGAYGQTFPGNVKSKSYNKHKKILNNFFFKNKNRRIIFVSHNVPYNTKLDKIGSHAHVLVRGKHFGSKLIRRTIDKWQPLIHIGGHIHEGRGIQKIGKTICINQGSVHENQGAILEIIKDKVKVNLIKL